MLNYFAREKWNVFSTLMQQYNCYFADFQAKMSQIWFSLALYIELVSLRCLTIDYVNRKVFTVYKWLCAPKILTNENLDNILLQLIYPKPASKVRSMIGYVDLEIRWDQKIRHDIVQDNIYATKGQSNRVKTRRTRELKLWLESTGFQWFAPVPDGYSHHGMQNGRTLEVHNLFVSLYLFDGASDALK